MTWIRTEQIRPSAAADADLILRTRAGDHTPFESLVEKFWRPLVGFVFRMVHDQTIAEEIAQEAFLRLYRTGSTYAGESQFVTSLYRIAANLATNQGSNAREKPTKAVSADQLEHETGLGPDSAVSPFPTKRPNQPPVRVDAIRREIDALPHQQRIAVLLHKYQGFDYSLIAEVLRLSESAAKSLLFTAYDTLREKLKEFM